MDNADNSDNADYADNEKNTNNAADNVYNKAQFNYLGSFAILAMFTSNPPASQNWGVQVIFAMPGYF